MPSAAALFAAVAPQASPDASGVAGAVAGVARRGLGLKGQGAEAGAGVGFEGLLAGLLQGERRPAGKLSTAAALSNGHAGHADDPSRDALAGLQAVLAGLISPITQTMPAQGQGQGQAQSAEALQKSVQDAVAGASPATLGRWEAKLSGVLARLETAQGRLDGAATANQPGAAEELAGVKAARGLVGSLLDTVHTAQARAAVAPAPAAPQGSLQAIERLQAQGQLKAQNQAPGSAEAAADQAAQAAAVAQAANTGQAKPDGAQPVLAAWKRAQTDAVDRRADPRARPAAAAVAGGEATGTKAHGKGARPEPLATDPFAAAHAGAKPHATAPQADEIAQAAKAEAPADAGSGSNPTAAEAAAAADTAQGAPAAHLPAKALATDVARGSPETVAHLAAQIARKADGRATHFELELHPADMGRVDVQLRIDHDGRIAAQLAFDNPIAAADFRARADELRRSLEQAGFQLTDDSLSFADRGGGGRSQDQANQFAGAFGDGSGGRGQGSDRGEQRTRAFRDGEMTTRLADAADRLQSRRQLGLDLKV